MFQTVLLPIINEKGVDIWTKPNSNIICFTQFNVGMALTFNREGF